MLDLTIQEVATGMTKALGCCIARLPAAAVSRSLKVSRHEEVSHSCCRPPWPRMKRHAKQDCPSPAAEPTYLKQALPAEAPLEPHGLLTLAWERKPLPDSNPLEPDQPCLQEPPDLSLFGRCHQEHVPAGLHLPPLGLSFRQPGVEDWPHLGWQVYCQAAHVPAGLHCAPPWGDKAATAGSCWPTSAAPNIKPASGSPWGESAGALPWAAPADAA